MLEFTATGKSPNIMSVTIKLATQATQLLQNDFCYSYKVYCTKVNQVMYLKLQKQLNVLLTLALFKCFTTNLSLSVFLRFISCYPRLHFGFVGFSVSTLFFFSFLFKT